MHNQRIILRDALSLFPWIFNFLFSALFLYFQRVDNEPRFIPDNDLCDISYDSCDREREMTPLTNKQVERFIRENKFTSREAPDKFGYFRLKAIFYRLSDNESPEIYRPTRRSYG